MRVAERLAAQLKRSYGKDVLAVLIDGSVARGDDTEYSDMELRVITRKHLRAKNMSETGFLEFVFKDLAVLLQFMEEKEVHELIRRPTVEWPIKVWPFLEPTLVLSSPQAELTVQGFRESYKALNPESFKPAVQWSLVWVWEMHGKVRSMIERRSRDVVWCAPSLAHNAALSVALINERYFHYGDSRYLSEIKSFPHLPKKFVSLFEQLQSSDSTRIEKAAREMWENCRSFAGKQGYPMEVHETWNELAQTIGFR